MITIVLTSEMPNPELEYIKARLDYTIKGKYKIVIPDHFDDSEIQKCSVHADILLGTYISSPIINKATALKLIQIPWAGIEYIDFRVLENSNVPVCNSHSNTLAVAEFGVGLLFDLTKKLSYYDRVIRNTKSLYKGNICIEGSYYLSEMSICILGYGGIGHHLARMLKPMCADVWAVGNKNRKDDNISRIYDRNNTVEAVSSADAIICTVPLTKDTINYISKDIFAHMKKGVLLINVSRGDVIDEKCLYNSLQNHSIGGYASDVWWNEDFRNFEINKGLPLTRNDISWKMDNIVISPHRADVIKDRYLHLDDVVENIINISNGKPLINIVDIKNQY